MRRECAYFRPTYRKDLRMSVPSRLGGKESQFAAQKGKEKGGKKRSGSSLEKGAKKAFVRFEIRKKEVVLV